jgi:maltokinase
MSSDLPATPPTPASRPASRHARRDDGTAPGGAADRPDDHAALVSLLTDWLPAQRWFAGRSGNAAGVVLADRLPVVDLAPGPEVELVLIDADTAAGRATYQLMLAWRADPPERVGHAIIGTIGDRICYDALHDHEVTSRLLAALARGETIGSVTGVAEPDADIDPTASGLVISAEQSNTSVVFGDAVILKMFRRLDAGTNPDVEVHRALHRAGCEHIAEPLGELVGPVHGSPTTLGLATRYFANSADGWAMATASVRDLMAEGDLHADEVGGDFAAEAHRLGEAVALVHRDLARAFGTRTMPGDDVAEQLGAMTAQAENLAAAVPPLQEHLDGIRETFRRAQDELHGGEVSIQRIHGDLHLGQALRTLRGWMLIDFEGEPSRPVQARRGMHSTLQDVAGMVRSFDYAAHQLFITGASDAQRAYRAAEWSRRNRSAFCDGYASVSGADPREPLALFGAFELSKAVYEVGYEYGHRPAWAPIPLAAVAELSGRN